MALTQDTTSADVALRLVARERATVGDVIDYEIRIRNLGPGEARNIRVSDPVPIGGTFVSATGGGALDADGVVRWPARERLRSGRQAFDTVRIRYDAAGRYRNTVSVVSDAADPDHSNNTATEQTTVAEPPQADLQVIKRGPEVASAGDTVEYIITTTNLGPDLADWIYVADELAEGAVFVSANRVHTVTDGVVQWDMIHIIEPGDSVMDTVRVVLPDPGSYTNTASVTQITADPDGSNDHSSFTTVVPSKPVDVGLEQSASPPDVFLGSGAFNLTVVGVGEAPTTDTIWVRSIMIPVGLTVVSLTTADGWEMTPSADPRFFEAWTTETLVQGARSSFSINVTVDTDAPDRLRHTAVVSTAGDDNQANDTATVEVGTTEPELDLEKRALTGQASIGDFVTYALTIENKWTQPFTEVILRDEFPPGFRFVEGSLRLDGQAIAMPDSEPTGSALEFAVGRLEPGERRTVTYQLLVGAGTRLGKATNWAMARDRPTGTESPARTAVVVVVDDGVFTEEGLIVGKVFAEVDSVRLGIPGVRIFLQDGRSVITDSEGNYNFVGLRPRLWVVRVDQSTLPAPGALTLRPLTSRNAGRGSSVFADLVRGEMHRVDFGAYETPEDTLWHMAEEGVRNRRRLAEDAESRGGGLTWPVLNGWGRDSTSRPDRGLPSAFGEILPGRSINSGNSGLGLRPADRLTAGLVGDRASQDGPLGLFMDPEERPIAQGDKTIRLRLEVAGSEEAGAEAPIVTLEASRGTWEAQDEDLDPVAPGLQVAVRGQRFLTLRAPSGAGDGTVRATAMGREVELTLPWTGDNRRPFLVTGLVEGQVDARSLEDSELFGGFLRDRLQDPLRDISFDSDDGRYSGGLRAAAFATGDIGDETSLTLRFDTEKDEGRRFFDDIRPQDFYGVYGDGSIKGFGAQSRGRVFGALERGRSYLMYGDFVTGMGRGEAQTLGRYNRTLTGVAQHFEKSMGSVGLRFDGFASYDRVTQVVDEIRGLGISGPYALSRADGLLNSEQVEVVVRDRNQPSIILSRERLTRFLDYSVEPFTGRLLFKRPIPTLDDQFNPVSVRVTYEVEEAAADRFWVYGVDGSLQASDRFEIGGGLVRDESSFGGIDLSSANATLGLTRNTFLFGELARSDSAEVMGDAARVELRHASSRVDARAYYIETDSTFSNRSSGFAGGRKEVGLRGRADITSRIQLLGEALRTESLVTGGQREGLQVGLRAGEAWSAEVGYRYAEETAPPSAETADLGPYDLNSLRARVTAPLPEDVEGAVFAEYEQDVEDADQRRLVIGGDLRLFARARVYGRHELISSLVGPYGLNPFQEQNNTVFGVAADYKAGTQVFSEYRARDAFAGREAQAAMGLRNQWSVADGMRLNTSFERLSPVGVEGRDALAVTGALEYTANPLWKGTVRSEYRSSGDQDHLLGSLGYAGRLTEDWTLLGQSVFSHVFDGPTYERSRIGLAYRDIQSNKWNSLWRYEHRYNDEPEAGIDWSRKAHIVSTHFDYRPRDQITFRGQYGAKYVTEGDDDQENSEPSSLVGARFTYDLDERFDIGVTGWALRTGGLIPAGGRVTFDDTGISTQNRYAVGAELGWTASRDLRIAAGYNAFGFIDDDLVPDQPTDQGFYVKVGFKVDRLWGDEPVIRPRPADVSVSMSGPGEAVAGEEARYWMFPDNNGPFEARDTELSHVLPPGAEFVEASEGYVRDGNTVRWSLESLRRGDDQSRFVRVRYPDPGVAVSETTVSTSSPDPQAANNTVSLRTVVGPYRLEIDKSGPTNAAPDSVVTYNITATNLGPLLAENVVVRDSLPVGALLVDPMVAGEDTIRGRVVTWPVGALAVDESATLELQVRYPLAGHYTNVAVVEAPEGRGRAAHEIEIGLPAEVRADLSGSGRALAGDTVRYTLHVHNDGNGVARNVRPQVVLPPGARFVSVDDLGSHFAGRIAWVLGSTPPGDDQVLDFRVVYEEVGLYRLEARVFSDFDNRSGTDGDAVQTLVMNWDLDIDVTRSPVTPDGAADYFIEVRNRGPAPAPSVVVEDSIAAAGTVIGTSRADVQISRDIVRFREVDIPAFGVLVDTVTVRYSRAGTHPNVGSASTPRHVVTDTVVTPIGLIGDIRIQQFGHVQALVGETVEYRLHVHNDGNGVARGVSVRDEIPVGAELVESSPAAVQVGDTLTWQLGDLVVGTDLTLTVRVRYGNAGLFQNRAVVESELDSDLSNNSSTLGTRVHGGEALGDGVPTISMTGPALVLESDTVTYLITTEGGGNGPVLGLVVEDSLPSDALFIGASRDGERQGRVVRWPALGALEPGVSVTDTLHVAYPKRGRYRNMATVSPRFDGVWDEVQTTVGLAAEVRTALFGAAAAQPGDTVSYNVHVHNDGNGVARGVNVLLELASGSHVVSASGGALVDSTSGIRPTITWPTVPSLRPGDELYETVSLAFSVPGTYRFEARGSSEFDPRLPSDIASVTTVIHPAPGISVELGVANMGTVNATDRVTYVIETETGSGPPTDVTLKGLLPRGAVFVRATGGGVHDAGIVRWELDGSDGTTLHSRTLEVTFPSGGVYTVVAIAERGSRVDTATLALDVQPLTDPTLEPVYFEFNRDRLTTDAKAELKRFGKQLQSLSPDLGIRLVGHTDSVGDTTFNRRLGQQRANSVRDFLRDSLGVQAERLVTFSRGESQTLGGPDAEDRRVEFYICYTDRSLDREVSDLCDSAPPEQVGMALRGPPRPREPLSTGRRTESPPGNNHHKNSTPQP